MQIICELFEFELLANQTAYYSVYSNYFQIICELYELFAKFTKYTRIILWIKTLPIVYIFFCYLVGLRSSIQILNYSILISVLFPNHYFFTPPNISRIIKLLLCLRPLAYPPDSYIFLYRENYATENPQP